jgi:hypothetical protein
MSYNSELQSNNADLQSILNKVNSLPDANGSGGIFLPELGDTAAQPTDIAAGKVLYDDEGNPVTGTLSEATEGILINSKSDEVLDGSAGALEFNVSGIYPASAIGDNTRGVIMRPGSRMAVRNVPTSLFGKATTNQVAKGATFTSEVGLLAEGELIEKGPGTTVSANENITINRNSDGTIAIYAKTNFGDNPDVIVRSGADLRIEAQPSAFDGIFGSGVEMSVEDDTLYITGDVTVENETLIL